MRDVPKIVSQRLEAAKPLDASHPDANVLTAFAERCLPQADRASVLEHLAVCAECREVLALGLPSSETAQPLLEASRSRNRTWPRFRWAVVSAGALAVALFAFVQYGHREQAERMAKNTPPPAPSHASTNMRPASAPESPTANSKLPAQVRNDRGEPAAASRSPIVAGTLSARSRQTNKSQQRVDSLQRYADESKPQVPATPSREGDLQAQAADSVIAANAPQAAPPTTLDTEVSRAKAPTASQGAASAMAPEVHSLQDLNVAAPTWTITAGRLQRSFDQGITWQNVNVSGRNDSGRLEVAVAARKAPEKLAKTDERVEAASPAFRAVAVNGSEVWAGGAEANLYHSSDAGNHWSRVMPSSGSISLTGDIVTLEFPDQRNGKIATSTGELWTTTDDGQTWNKQ
jgi:hypothetical protein